MLEKLKKNLLFYSFLFLILALAFWVRIYGIDKLLGFYYDQGRDALVIWDLIHNHKLFLIGPTTGLAGIFRGPYYYYLITPFYFLGRGNPLYPEIFLILTTVGAVGFVYVLASKIYGKVAGMTGVILASFSLYIVLASRWLSNPTPMLLLSMILVWGMFKVTEGYKWGWPIIAGTFGLSLFSFGSSGEFFYLPALIIFFLWQKKNWPDKKNLILSIFLFGLTIAPLIIFDLKHGGILRGNVFNSFVGEKSFALPTQSLIADRSQFLYDNFTKVIFNYRGPQELAALLIIAVWFILFLPRYFKNPRTLILILLLAAPTIGLYFYRGNEGALYDYYMTGYWLIFILLISSVLGHIWKYPLGKVFVIFFLYLFLTNNYPFLKNKLMDNSENPESITFVNQKKSIDWIYENSEGRDFNVDVYVPPVIPYAYDYLFKWYGGSKHGRLPIEKNIPLLYTLYEVDPSHPERLDAWLARQKGIGKVLDQSRFGGIVVQERERFFKIK